MKSTTRKTLPVVTKSNALISGRGHLTLQESRLVLLALSKIDPRKPLPKDALQISVAEYKGIFSGSEGKIYEHLDIASSALMSRVVKVETATGWEKFQWVSHSKLRKKEGIIEIKFHEKMAPFITELRKCFTKIELPQLAGFTSVHALRIYENMLKWEPETCLETTVEDLKRILGLYDEKKKKFLYPAFKDFENFVLKVAKEQIEMHTPHRLEYTKVGGRGPAGIRLLKFYLTFKNKKSCKEAYEKMQSTITQIGGETVEQPSFDWTKKDTDTHKKSPNYFDEESNPF